MKRVNRYPLKPGQNVIELPEDSEVLHVDSRNGGISMWALVDPDPDLPVYEHEFEVVPTGQPFEADDYMYVGSAVIRYAHDELVFHVFAYATEF